VRTIAAEARGEPAAQEIEDFAPALEKMVAPIAERRRDGDRAPRRAGASLRVARRSHELVSSSTTANAASSRSATGSPTTKGPGGSTVSFYDLLGSEARVASFIAIRARTVPQEHWFRSARALVGVEGVRAGVVERLDLRVSDAAAVLRSHPETLLENTCRAVVRAQILHGQREHVPWGISESAFHSSTSTATTSTRPSAFRDSASSAV
jgi:hypothetical protein